MYNTDNWDTIMDWHFENIRTFKIYFDINIKMISMKFLVVLHDNYKTSIKKKSYSESGTYNNLCCLLIFHDFGPH